MVLHGADKHYRPLSSVAVVVAAVVIFVAAIVVVVVVVIVSNIIIVVEGACSPVTVRVCSCVQLMLWLLILWLFVVA